MGDKTRRERIIINLSGAELDAINQMVKQTGFGSRSGFIRNMVLRGYIIQLDLEPLKKSAALMSRISGNVNQIAKRANRHELITPDNFDEVLRELRQLQQDFNKILDAITTLASGETKSEADNQLR